MSRVFIIASGSSLRGFDFHRLDNDITIGINYIFKFYTPTILHINDMQLYKSNKAEMQNLKCIKAFNNHRNPEAFIGSGAYLLTKSTQFYGKDGLTKGIYTRIITGTSAISLAIALELKPIYLLGFDCDEKGHWYQTGVNSRGDRNRNVYKNTGRFSVFSNESDIYDCALAGNLRIFPKKDIEEILANPEQIDKESEMGRITERLKGCHRT